MMQKEFVQFAGDLAESLSFNKSLGQIYGLLYLSPAPLSLDEISQQLMMSKGNASINLRTLESWGAARSVSISGSRRDHYEANRDLKEIILRRMQAGLGRRLDMVDDRLGGLVSSLRSRNGDVQAKIIREKLTELQGLSSKVRRGLRALDKLAKII